MGSVRGHWRNGHWVRPHTRRGGFVGVGVGVVAAGAVAVTLVGGGTPSKPDPDTKSVRQPATVEAVVDGDTLRVRLRDGSEERVRLLAIDTPEVGRNGQAGDCFAGEAEDLTTQLVEQAARVVLVSDPTQPDRDPYDRLLRYVRLDGADLGEQLLEAGAARVWVGDPPAQRLEAYQEAQKGAEDADAGLWGRC